MVGPLRRSQSRLNAFKRAPSGTLAERSSNKVKVVAASSKVKVEVPSNKVKVVAASSKVKPPNKVKVEVSSHDTSFDSLPDLDEDLPTSFRNTRSSLSLGPQKISRNKTTKSKTVPRKRTAELSPVKNSKNTTIPDKKAKIEHNSNAKSATTKARANASVGPRSVKPVTISTPIVKLVKLHEQYVKKHENILSPEQGRRELEVNLERSKNELEETKKELEKTKKQLKDNMRKHKKTEIEMGIIRFENSQKLEEMRNLKRDAVQARVAGRNEICKKLTELVDGELSCPLCYEVFVEPSVIECGHTFCRRCVEECAKKKKECPYCEKKFKHHSRNFGVYNFLVKYHEAFPASTI